LGLKEKKRSEKKSEKFRPMTNFWPDDITHKIKKELNNEGSNIKLFGKKVDDVILKRRFEVMRF